MVQIDVKKIAEKLIDAIKKDPKLLTSFTKNPIKAVEKVTGINLPDEKINALIKEVKAKAAKEKDGKLDMDKITNGLALLSTLTGGKTTSKKDKDIDIEDIAKGVKTITSLLNKKK